MKLSDVFGWIAAVMLVLVLTSSFVVLAIAAAIGTLTLPWH